MKKNAKNVLFAAVFFLAHRTEARWMTNAESDIAVQSRVQLHVEEDGRMRTETVTSIRVLNETGRARVGTLRFNYGPKNESLKVVGARTQNGADVFKVGASEVVDTEILATENGFDQSRQVVISFPQVRVGSVLSFETKEDVHKPFIEGQASARFFVGKYDLEEKVDYEITSVRRLFLEVNDPEGRLVVEKNEKEKNYRYAVHLKAPFVRRAVDEVRANVEERHLTWFVFSTARTYAALFGGLADRYEDLLKAPLPARFQALVEVARKEKTPVEKINSVASNLAGVVRYMGDWRAVDGGFVPRTMKLIAETQSGDCKDMSLVTAKMLRALGFDATIGLTIRGTPARSLPSVPYLVFNHAIVAVHVDGRDLWVDPTNFQSFADGVPEDIGGRDALVMKTTELAMRPIAYTPPTANSEVVKVDLHFLADRRRREKTAIDFTGSKAFPYVGNELRFSRAQIEESTLAGNMPIADLIHSEFGPWSLKSRIVGPVHLDFRVERRFHPLETSRGLALEFRPPANVGDLDKVDRAHRVSAIGFGPPSTAETTVELENVEMLGDRLGSCVVRSPWLDYEFTLTKKPLRVTRRLTVKTDKISREEVNSPEFGAFEDEVRKCGNAKYLIYRQVR